MFEEEEEEEGELVKRITFIVPEELHYKLRVYCTKRRMTIKEFCTDVLTNLIDKKLKKKKKNKSKFSEFR